MIESVIELRWNVEEKSMRTLILLVLPMVLSVSPSSGRAQEPSSSKARVFKLGGERDDRATDVAVHRDGSFVVAGYFTGSVDFGLAGDQVVLKSAAGRGHTKEAKPGDGKSAFLVAYAADGTCRWAHRFGGPDFTGFVAVGMDQTGDVFVAGHSYGSFDFDPGPGAVEGRGRFLSRFDRNGSFRSTMALPAEPRDLAVDADGNAFVSMRENSAVLVAKIGPDGSREWLRRVEVTGTSPAPRAAVATTLDGGCLFVPCSRPADTKRFRTRLIRYGRDGGERWSATLDGVHVMKNQCAVEQSGVAYIAGSVVGECDFDPGPETHTLDAEEPAQGFVARFGPDGRFLNVFSLGQAGATAVVLRGAGDIVITGAERKGHGSNPGKAEFGLFVNRFTSAGELVWSYPIDIDSSGGMHGDNLFRGVGCDGEGRITAVGQFGTPLVLPDGERLEPQPLRGHIHDILVARIEDRR